MSETDTVKGRHPSHLIGNELDKYYTRLTKHTVGTWIPEELIDWKKTTGPTLTFFGHVDRAVQGFCTIYTQQCRHRYIGKQFTRHVEGFTSGMLFPFLEARLGLISAKVCVWICPRCGELKADQCKEPEYQPCPFQRTGPMTLVRGRLLLRFGGRFASREFWRCNNPACRGHGFYFFAQTCHSHCRKEMDHDTCPLCGHDHPIGRANRTVAGYDYLTGHAPSVVPPPAPVPAPPAPANSVSPAKPPVSAASQPPVPSEPYEEVEPDTGEGNGDDDSSEEKRDHDSRSGPIETLELAAEAAIDMYQHHPPWLRELILLLAEEANGKFPWLKALLPKVEVDWKALHGRVKDGLARRQLDSGMLPPQFRNEFTSIKRGFHKTTYQQDLLEFFSRRLLDEGYNLEDLAGC